MSVFHLKYRPVSLADLDSIEVGEKLKLILTAEVVVQSFLFAGPKGAGKTSAARILARIVNCEKVKNGEACGKCDSCKEISRGGSIDILEIDAASNRGIEDVRSLKDKAYLSPARLKNKVFIIDEVHMLTREAFNALLKLIEEPPEHTYFVLCTTEAQKIPETVLSRLVKVDFRKGKKADLVKSIRRIVKGEDMEVSEEVIELLVAHSDGSFRNLQKKFNEVVLELGKKLDRKMVEKYLESNDGDYTPEQFEEELRGGKVGVILEKLEEMEGRGADFKGFREKLMQYFQERLLGLYSVAGKEAGGWTKTELQRWLNILIGIGRIEKEVTVGQLPLEMAVVEYMGEGIKSEGKKAEKPAEDEEAKLKIVDNKSLREKLEADWSKVLVAVKPFNHSVEAFLRAARPKTVNGKTVVCEVFYPFHKDKLEEERNRRVVEEGLAIVLGTKVEFRCVLSKNKNEALVIKNDTPLEDVSFKLAGEVKAAKSSEDKIYETAKEIFG